MTAQNQKPRRLQTLARGWYRQFCRKILKAADNEVDRMVAHADRDLTPLQREIYERKSDGL